MTGQQLRQILDHAGKEDENVVGFRLANGGRIMFTDPNNPFDLATNMVDSIGMIYKKLVDSSGNVAHSYTEQDEVIQVILRDDMDKHLFVRDVIE